MHGYDRYMRIRLNQLGRGHFCIPALGGLLTRENTSEIFLHCRWKRRMDAGINEVLFMHLAAFDRCAAFIWRWRGCLRRWLHLWTVQTRLMKNIDESSLIDCSIKQNTDRLGWDICHIKWFLLKEKFYMVTVMRGGSRLIVTNDICNLGITGVLHWAAV